jgi:IrrE N-terminal-like domain
VTGRDKALHICEKHFPDGLERLIEALSVTVKRSDLGNVDGWCYRLPDGSRIVRLNSAATKERQRFTLAHELAHFVLGSQRRTMTLFWDVYNPKSQEERDADDLASRLLLPGRRVTEIIEGYAIDYSTIKEIKNRAKVSDIVVALRLAKSGDEFGLDSPTVVWFESGQIKSVLPVGRNVSRQSVVDLFHKAAACPDHTVRARAKDGAIIIASILPNTNYPTLFIYRADPQSARSSPRREEVKSLEDALFKDDDYFRRCLNGCIGGHKKSLLDLDVMERVEFVIEKFAGSYTQRPDEHLVKIRSQQCLEWLYIKMEELG